MPRRVTMPDADELFRNTAGKSANPAIANEEQPSAEQPLDAAGGASGRIRHDEKMTVYLTAAELMSVEKARLELHGKLGRKVDRGRFVRAALALALEGLDAEGIDSEIARRLSQT